MAAVMALRTSIDGTSYPGVMGESGVEKNLRTVRVGIVTQTPNLGPSLV